MVVGLNISRITKICLAKAFITIIKVGEEISSVVGSPVKFNPQVLLLGEIKALKDRHRSPEL